MIEYKCSKCDKSFNTKKDLNRHLNRRKSCDEIISDFKCEHCNKKYTRRYNLIRHMEEKHINSKTKNTNNGNNSIGDKNISQNGDNNNVNITNQYFLLPFGSYQLEKDLSIEDILAIFSSKCGAIEMIILKTHLNPKLPQYHNCGITDLHVSYGLIYDGASWIFKPITDIMHDLIENGQKKSLELYDKIKNFIQDDIREEIKNDLDDDKYLLYPRHDHDKNDRNAKRELVKHLKPNFYNQRGLVKTAIKNSGKEIIEIKKSETSNILKQGVTFQDIEAHLKNDEHNKKKLSLKKELAMYILKEHNNINDFKYFEIMEKINKTNTIEHIDILTKLLIKSYCSKIDINNIVVDQIIRKAIGNQVKVYNFLRE